MSSHSQALVCTDEYLPLVSPSVSELAYQQQAVWISESVSQDRRLHALEATVKKLEQYDIHALYDRLLAYILVDVIQ